MTHVSSVLQHRRNVHVHASNSPYGKLYRPNILSEIPYGAQSVQEYLYIHSVHCTVYKDLARRLPLYGRAPELCKLVLSYSIDVADEHSLEYTMVLTHLDELE
jgi:hypothetical protein